MKKTKFDAQKNDAKFAKIEAQLLAQQGIFAMRGWVQANWRNYRGRQLGPYYRIYFREGKCLKSIYLGRSAELAGRVDRLLVELQAFRRERRHLSQFRRKILGSLRRNKKELETLLAPLGFHRKGSAILRRRS